MSTDLQLPLAIGFVNYSLLEPSKAVATVSTSYAMLSFFCSPSDFELRFFPERAIQDGKLGMAILGSDKMEGLLSQVEDELARRKSTFDIVPSSQKDAINIPFIAGVEKTFLLELHKALMKTFHSSKGFTESSAGLYFPGGHLTLSNVKDLYRYYKIYHPEFMRELSESITETGIPKLSIS